MGNDYSVDRKRWDALGIFDQMGNTSAEVGRTIQAKKSGDESKFKAALTRALDLFEATVESQIAARRPYRAREVLRAQEQFLALFFGDNTSRGDERNIEKYFMQYAIAARLNR